MEADGMLVNFYVVDER